MEELNSDFILGDTDIDNLFDEDYTGVDNNSDTPDNNNEDNKDLRGKIFGLYNVDNRIGNAEFLSLLHN